MLNVVIPRIVSPAPSRYATHSPSVFPLNNFIRGDPEDCNEQLNNIFFVFTINMFLNKKSGQRPLYSITSSILLSETEVILQS